MKAIQVQPDGKVLIAGGLTSHNGVSRSGVARVDAQGRLDASFDPGTGVAATATVESMVLQPDGRVLIAGAFASFDGTARGRIARLNADGTLDTSFASGTGADATVESIALQPDGKVLIAGRFASFDGAPRGRIARLNADGSLDSSFDPGAGADATVKSVALQPDGKVLIAGAFASFDGAPRGRVARLNADGSLDSSFDPGTGAGPDPRGNTIEVRALALQSDGKVLIGGEFTTYDGVDRHRIARLNADGALDTSFDPGSGANVGVEAVTLQSDGGVLIAGSFTFYDGAQRSRIARLNADGALDVSFDPGVGTDATVESVAVQLDGKLLIGGWFRFIDGTPRRSLGRLFADGVVDMDFNAGAGPNEALLAVAVQPDNKVLIGGWFITFNDTERRHVARLNTDGSLDPSFATGTGAGSTSLTDPYVSTLAVQPDGKVLIGGHFTSFDGVERGRVARLNSDGSLDASFDSTVGANDTVWRLVLQADGKLMIVGSFTTYDGVSRNRVARLNSDGSLDTSFNPGSGASGWVRALARQPDGKYLIGGGFTSYNGTPRKLIARLNSDGSLDPSFHPGTGANRTVNAIALQPDGRAVIAGGFYLYDGTERMRIARVNADGSLDWSFDPGAGASDDIDAIVLQPDGKLLIGGRFSNYSGTPRGRLARVNADGGSDATFVPGFGASFDVRALAPQLDGKLVIGGAFTAYNGVVRHRIARVFTVAPGVTTSYCTAGTSAIGCTPTMSASGVASASATSGYLVTTFHIEGQRQTTTFYSVLGPRTPATPFGAGLLCVNSPTQRIGSVQASGTPGLCNGSVSIDVLAWAQAHPGAQGMPFTLGTTLNVQCAIRDPLSPGARVASNALQVTLLP